MHELTERDWRFHDAWCRWYTGFVEAVLGVAWRVLPRRLYNALAKFAVDTAWPMGVFAAWCYCNVRDAGDILRWLVYG